MRKHIIVALGPGGAIGSYGRLPWDVPEDLVQFASLTTGVPGTSAVLMGRDTYRSIPASRRPLPRRLNLVLSHRAASLNAEEGLTELSDIVYCESVPEACRIAESRGITDFWICGGASVYELAGSTGLAEDAYVTRIAEERLLRLPNTYVAEDVVLSGLKLQFSTPAVSTPGCAFELWSRTLDQETRAL